MLSLKEFIILTSRRPLGIRSLRPFIFCMDGFMFSVQGSQYHYCSPREDNKDSYSSMEVGYPNLKEPLLMNYLEVKGGDPLNSVYPYVDVEVIEKVIEKHGGISVNQTFEK